MPRPEYLTLCWNGRSLGRITEVQVFDWPWVCGRLAFGEWPPRLQEAVEALARDDDDFADGDDDPLPDPPYPDGSYVGWSVMDPTGAVLEIGVPRVDFATGEIEWR